MAALIRTKNDKKNNLGLPLPSGRVQIFETVGKGQSAQRLLAAETQLRDITIDEITEFELRWRAGRADPPDRRNPAGVTPAGAPACVATHSAATADQRGLAPDRCGQPHRGQRRAALSRAGRAAPMAGRWRTDGAGEPRLRTEERPSDFQAPPCRQTIRWRSATRPRHARADPANGEPAVTQSETQRSRWSPLFPRGCDRAPSGRSPSTPAPCPSARRNRSAGQ